MLVLRRRVGESISIGDGIEIEVVEISRTRVKLGVVAPRDVPVVRKETIGVAAENRRALELVTSGPEGVREAVQLLRGQLSSRTPSRASSGIGSTLKLPGGPPI